MVWVLPYSRWYVRKVLESSSTIHECFYTFEILEETLNYMYIPIYTNKNILLYNFIDFLFYYVDSSTVEC